MRLVQYNGEHGVQAVTSIRVARVLRKQPLPLKPLTGRAHLPRAERERLSRARQEARG